MRAALHDLAAFAAMGLFLASATIWLLPN